MPNAFCLLPFCLVASTLLSLDTIAAASRKNIISCQEISTWNHIHNKTSRYLNLSSELGKYRFFKDNKACNKTNNISGVLVKNIIDWEQQHSNGVEINLSSYGLTFSSLHTFSFGLKLDNYVNRIADNKAQTLKRNKLLSLMTHVNVKHSGNIFLTSLKKTTIANALTDEFIHLNIIFYGANHHDVHKKTIYASYPIQQPSALSLSSHFSAVSNNQFQEPWKPIHISISELAFYVAKDYNEEPVEYDDVKDQSVLGVLLMAESANHKVLRNYAPSVKFNEGDMLFNEVSFSLQNITLETNVN